MLYQWKLCNSVLTISSKTNFVGSCKLLNCELDHWGIFWVGILFRIQHRQTSNKQAVACLPNSVSWTLLQTCVGEVTSLYPHMSASEKSQEILPSGPWNGKKYTNLWSSCGCCSLAMCIQTEKNAIYGFIIKYMTRVGICVWHLNDPTYYTNF